MSIVFLALGSNRGDRAANLRFAVEKLSQQGIVVEAKSKIYSSQSVESGGEGDFLNAVVRAQFEGTARELLEICQSIEAQTGRPAPPRVGPRALDLDILTFGDEQIQQSDLQIPHPRLALRAFVLKPLLDVVGGGWVNESDEKWLD